MSVSVGSVVSALEAASLVVGTRGEIPREVTLVTDDSRRVVPGALFLAIRGASADGHRFIDDAVTAGASLLIAEERGEYRVPSIVVSDGRRAAAIVAAVAYDHPARSLQLVGVTGTNGKTTTTGIIRHLLDGDGSSASIGTVGVLVGSAGRAIPTVAELTTPGPIDLQRVLRQLVEEGVRSVAMEVSSHSLDQRRVDGLEFEVAVFTNLTRDHLDYHGSMESYLAAKSRLLDLVCGHGVAVVNADADWRGLNPRCRTMTFGIHNDSEIRAGDVRYTPAGSEWTLTHAGQRAPVRMPLFGEFNIHNALAAAASCIVLGMKVSEIAVKLETLPQIPGRLELLSASPVVIRDYAHTPDALERALQAVKPAKGRLIVVFGCGGDRDKGKRPEMGRIAGREADVVILTSDNPRNEDPERILDDIAAGIERTSYERVEDRRAAIARAIEMAREDDVVLLAGKGHENYQVRGAEKVHFDEKEIVARILAGAVAR